MITVIGRFFTDTIASMEMEEELWKQICHAYQVDRLILLPATYQDLRLTDRNAYDQYETMEEALTTVTGKRVYFIPPQTAIDNNLTYTMMSGYTYPQDIVIIFGESFYNNVRHITENDDVVSIALPDDNRGVYGVSINGIVLRDRWIKNGNN